jgi:hypothetical protein
MERGLRCARLAALLLRPGARACSHGPLRAEVQEAGLGRARVGPSRAREDCRPGLDPAAGVAGESGVEEKGQHDSVKVYQHTSMVLDVQVTGL